MKKKWIWVLIVALLLWGFCVYKVNRFYDLDRIPTEDYRIGEWMTYDNEYSYGEMVSGYEIRVNSFYIIQCEEFLARYGKTRKDFVVGEGFGEKLGIVSLSVMNTSNYTGQALNLREMHLYGKDFYSMQFVELFGLTNPDLNDALGVTLEPGESKDIQLVFNFRKADFTAYSWKRLERLSMKLFVTAYPIQKNIILQAA